MNRIAWALVVGCMLLLLIARCGRERAETRVDTREAPPRPVAERVVGGLREPVALAFLSPTVMLVAERRAGRIRWVENGALRDEPFAMLPVPNPSGYHEYGLLGLAVDPRYPDRPYIYAFHTVQGRGGGGDGQRIVRFTVQDGKGTALTTVVDGLPSGTRCCHNGGRLLFGADGMLYVTLGDTQRPESAQDYGALSGKLLRYTPGGGIPADNPLEEQRPAGARTDEQAQQTMPSRRIPAYTIGHRNPFGIAMNPAGDLYVTENGPDHDDEINRLVAGDNYGWPVVMGRSSDAHFRNPVWASGRATIAPTGAAFYTGDALPMYRGNLFFASYTDGRLRRVVFENRDHVSDILAVPVAGNNARLDVAMGLDGHLYYSSLDAVYRLRAEE